MTHTLVLYWFLHNRPKMANLKHDLDEYLLLQSDQKKTNFKIDMKMPSIKVPEIKNLFGKSQPQEVNGWLEETKESCCPKLVCSLQSMCAYYSH